MVAEQIATIKSINPATREELGEVPCLGSREVDSAVDSAWKAYEDWRLTTYKQRAALMNSLRKVISKQEDEIAQLITREVGKPLVESYMSELTGPLDACMWFGQNTERLLKDQLIAMTNPVLMSKQSVISFEPKGVVGIISPWNYPFAIPMMSIIMCLMVGNTVVLKPSEKSPLTGIKIGELFELAGFPQGAVVVVTGDRNTGALLSQSRLGRLIFTGSASGGSKVMAQSAPRVTPITLELGGKDAAIVLPDAPVDWTARGLVWGAFTNCGQACASVERLYIVKGRNTDELIERITFHARNLKLGSGLDSQTEVGPLIDEIQLEKVKSQVEAACKAGAQVLCGGKERTDLGGYFFEPTVLTNVNHNMQVMNEETFGPVLPLMVVESEDEAVELANQSDYGLAASVWTGNLSRAEAIAEDLEVGMVTINDGLFNFACPQLPWGGLKKSGFGRSHSHFGLMDLVNIKHVSIDAAGGARREWWFPYNQSRVKAARGGLDLLFGASAGKKISGLIDFVGNSFFAPKT